MLIYQRVTILPEILSCTEMYTSGSTGLPKGAMIEHKGMVNHLYAKLEDVAATGEDVLIQNASQGFDVSVFQFISELVLGGQIVIVSEAVAYDPEQLLDCVAGNGVTLLEVVPSMIRMLLAAAQESEENKRKLMGLRWLISTGDALLGELCAKWFELYPQIPILNTYGPTECSDDVLHYPLEKPLKNIEAIAPIGKPIRNMQAYVLDRRLQPVPVGVMGELYLGGLGVGRGYLHDPERTAEAFLLNPFTKSAHNRLYKTGDLVRRLEGGEIEFIGRLNTQVKIRGYRVGLGEIESVLRQHENIKESVVTVGEHGGEKHLCGYFTLTNPQMKIDTAELRQYLKTQLPEYMIPSFFVELTALPLNSNGKIDKKQLPVLDYQNLAEYRDFIAPRNSTELALAEILQNILKLTKIGVNAYFFDMGGDSLAAIRYKYKIDRNLSIELPLAAIFTYPTIEMLAKFIDEQFRIEEF